MLSVRFLVKVSSGDIIKLNIAVLPNSHKVKGLFKFLFTLNLKFTKLQDYKLANFRVHGDYLALGDKTKAYIDKLICSRSQN